jgi:hypothetical protein
MSKLSHFEYYEEDLRKLTLVRLPKIPETKLHIFGKSDNLCKLP